MDMKSSKASKMRGLAQEATQTFKGTKAEQTGTANKKGGFAHNDFISWKVCKNILIFGLLFGGQLIAECVGPQTMTKVTQRPGYYSSHTVTYDGPNAPSIFQGLEKAGYSRVSPGHQPKRLDSILHSLKGKGTNSQMPGRQPFGFVSPPKDGRQDSGSYSPFSDMQKKLDNMRKSMFQGLSIWGQGAGRMKRKPTQVLGYGSDNSEGGLPKLGGWAPLGGTTTGKKKKTGRWTGHGTDSDDTSGRSPLGGNGVQTGGANRPGSGDFHQENLDAHNKYRKKHGVPPLRLNNEMSQISKRWAEHLASRGSIYGIYHSKEKFRKGYGENIHASYGTRETGRTAVDSWYSEINNYDFKTGTSTNGKMIGHLTQLLWKTSQELGVGYAFSSDGSIFVVCHYNPAGNYVGENTKNVPPIGGFSKEDVRRQADENVRQRQMMFGPMQSFFDKF